MLQKHLSKKEVKNIYSIIKSQWDIDIRLDYEFFLSQKNNIYIINKDLANFDVSNLKINSIGIYFGEYINGTIRLSIEGSQILGSLAKRNIYNVNEESAKKWLSGESLLTEETFNGFVIIKYENDFLGCGKVVDKKILNYVPKNRRIKAF